jgi:hypothetical protein
VPGVKHVLDVKISQRPVIPAQEPAPAVDQVEEAPPPPVPTAPLTAMEGRRLDVSPDTLICSLDHEVVVSDL